MGLSAREGSRAWSGVIGAITVVSLVGRTRTASLSLIARLHGLFSRSLGADIGGPTPYSLLPADYDSSLRSSVTADRLFLLKR